MSFLCKDEKLNILYFANDGSVKADVFIKSFKKAVGVKKTKDIVMVVKSDYVDETKLYICPKGSAGERPKQIHFDNPFKKMKEYLNPEFVKSFSDIYNFNMTATIQPDVYDYVIKDMLSPIEELLSDPRYKIVGRSDKKITFRDKSDKRIKIEILGRKLTSDTHYNINQIRYYTDNIKTRTLQVADYNQLKEVYYNRKGEIHREDGPAVIYYSIPNWLRPFDNKTIKVSEMYYINNKIYREKGKPRVIIYNRDGSISQETYSIEDGACFIRYYYTDGTPQADEYRNRDHLVDRRGGPAKITYYDTGEVHTTQFYVEGHRQGPKVYYNRDGTLIEEEEEV